MPYNLVFRKVEFYTDSPETTSWGTRTSLEREFAELIEEWKDEDE